MNPTPLAYPACRTPHALHTTVCQACGLVFGSQFPDQPLQPGQMPAQGRYTVERALSQHLATDDDPRAHPFNFPQLDQLGPLGEVLRAALDQDVTRQPTATTLREQLTALLSDLGKPLLRAPDGTGILTTEALVAWCEAHWAAAADWLYGNLPDQIERWWGAADIAAELRTSVQQHIDRNAGLDAVLAWLDPHIDLNYRAPLLRQWSGDRCRRDTQPCL